MVMKKRLILLIFGLYLLPGFVYSQELESGYNHNNPNVYNEVGDSANRKGGMNDIVNEWGIYCTPVGLSTMNYAQSETNICSHIFYNVGIDFRRKTVWKLTKWNFPLWWSVGAGISRYDASYRPNTTLFSPEVIDPVYGYRYVFSTSFDNFVEYQRLRSLGISFSGMLEVIDRLRIGVGCELSAPIYKKYWYSGTLLTNYRDCDIGVEYGSDLDAHGVGSRSFEVQERSLDVRNVLVTPFLDIYYQFYKEFSLGVYLGYELVPLYRKGAYGNKELVQLSEGQVFYSGIVHSNHIQNSNWLTEGIHPLTAGVRLRYVWSINNKKENKDILVKLTKERNDLHKKNESLQYQVDSLTNLQSGVNNAHGNDSTYLLAVKVLLNSKMRRDLIDQALKDFNNINDSILKRDNLKYYDALVQYPQIYDEFRNIVKDARRKMETGWPSDEAK
mgnify:FL=1